MYAGLSGQYIPDHNHYMTSRTQYINAPAGWETTQPLRPMWPWYLALGGAVLLFISVLVGGI